MLLACAIVGVKNHNAEHDRSIGGLDQSNFDESEIDSDKSNSNRRDGEQASGGTFGEYNETSGKQHKFEKNGYPHCS